MKKIIVVSCILLILSGCEMNAGGNTFYHQINEIEIALENSDWDETLSEAENLKEMYKKQKWKLQLLGDENEYEGLNESIHKLISAIKLQDLVSIKMELITIQTNIENIYSL